VNPSLVILPQYREKTDGLALADCLDLDHSPIRLWIDQPSEKYRIMTNTMHSAIRAALLCSGIAIASPAFAQVGGVVGSTAGGAGNANGSVDTGIDGSAVAPATRAVLDTSSNPENTVNGGNSTAQSTASGAVDQTSNAAVGTANGSANAGADASSDSPSVNSSRDLGDTTGP
jgi:hypothetical protein